MCRTDITRNVPLSGEHIDTCLYVPTKWGHLYKESLGTIHCNLYLHNGELMYKVDNIYYYRGLPFTIKDGIFTSGELSFTLPTRTSISTVERLALGLGHTITGSDKTMIIDLAENSFKDVLLTCVYLALKDLSIIPNNMNSSKQLAYAKHILGSYIKAVNGSGQIKASNPHIRWLNEKDTKQLKAKLFQTSSYQPGVNSMAYTPTDFAEGIFEKAFELIKSLDFKDSNVELQSLDFLVDINNLKDMRFRDIMLLLNNCKDYSNGFIIRPEIEDRHYSRIYSVFTSISSATRKQLGFINYDIGSALQAICMHLVEDKSNYPMHMELVKDKHTFRQKIADEIGEDLAWVKKELSSSDNRENMPKKYALSPTLKAYYEESLVLRKEIIKDAEPILLSRATDFAKTKFVKTWVTSQKKPKWVPNGKKESSIFFFIWTQWERQIREAMMSCFKVPTACHQVHDAVYSKEDINTRIIEDRVLKDTGFKVKIFKD